MLLESNTELLHELNLIPDIYYYQLTEKPSWMIYQEQRTKIIEKLKGNRMAGEFEDIVSATIGELLAGLPGIK